MKRLGQLAASLIAVVALAFVASPAGASGLDAYGPTAAAATITVTVSVNGATGVVTVTITGNGFGASQTITLTLYSTPESLGTVQTNASGAFSNTVTLPAGVPAGTHTIVATDQQSGQTASASFTLAQASGPFGAAAPSAGPTQAGPSGPAPAAPTARLPITGVDVAVLTGMGAVAIALGGFLVLSARRRRSGNWAR